MPAPTDITYSLEAKIAAHEDFLTLIAAGASASVIKIRNASDVLLATCTLDDPPGVVDAGTGRLDFTLLADEFTVTTQGQAAYAEFVNGSGVVHLAAPCAQGLDAISNRVVLNSLTLVAGQPISIISASIG